MNLGALISESRNPATMELDKLSTLEMLACINDEDRKVPEAIRLVIPAIAQAVDLAAAALKQGGRLILSWCGER
ncbi:N-acetylmuramic acid 6-phosphate etherase, partial [Yersinia frederiksenii]